MTKTHIVPVFKKLVESKNIDMVPRSKYDKEFFPQDWFADRLNELSLSYDIQGRNSYPDFWIKGKKDSLEGYEIKSLEYSDNLRKTIDFNSTVPCGRKFGKDMFLVFFLYEKDKKKRTIHTLSVVHLDFINLNNKWKHANNSIPNFGSYGDGCIRNRKMYLFPHPLTLYPEGLGRCQLILPEGYKVKGLKKTDTIKREVLKQTVSKYEINLEDQSSIEITYCIKNKKRKNIMFNVFEVKQ